MKTPYPKTPYPKTPYDKTPRKKPYGKPSPAPKPRKAPYSRDKYGGEDTPSYDERTCRNIATNIRHASERVRVIELEIGTLHAAIERYRGQIRAYNLTIEELEAARREPADTYRMPDSGGRPSRGRLAALQRLLHVVGVIIDQITLADRAHRARAISEGIRPEPYLKA